MQEYVPRVLESDLERALGRSPAVAVLGPRQCGKSTVARRFVAGVRSIYLDLQDRVDVNKLNEPELFFDQYRDHLICLDEIQRLPEFFSVLRSEIDRDRRPGRFLILGSASRDLLRQSTESLAGRIAYLDLTPFLIQEADAATANWRTHWLRGGFPESLLANDDEDSYAWRRDFIRTYLERDIPQLGWAIPAPVMERLWRLLAHYHGQTVNYSKIATACDLSIPTLKRYLALLEQTYMIRCLLPFDSNLKKRLVRAPKIYLRDSGILHSLLDVSRFDRLLAHPLNGPSWEGHVLESIIASRPHARPSFLRTSGGAEIDLVLSDADGLDVYEVKLSKAPKPSRGFHTLVEDLRPRRAFLVAPVDDTYPYGAATTVISPQALLSQK